MLSRSFLILSLTVLVVLTVGFYFAGNAQAVVPAGCDDTDSNGCISTSDCDSPSNDPALGGTCSICPAGNCGQSLGNGDTDLGGSCRAPGDCVEGLICSQRGTCLECDSDPSQCEQGETCNFGLCLRPGGNLVGDFCGENSQCASGNCGRSARCLPVSDTGGGERGGPTDEADWMGVDLTIQDVFAIINGLACWTTRVAVFIMVIFIILAGLRFMNARGDPAAFTAARKNFNHVLIGLIVIMGVYVIIATIANAVGVTDFSFIPLVC